MGAHLDRAREHFRQFGRTPSFGLRTHLVVRESEDAAWAAAAELLSQADAVVQEQRLAAVSGTSMVGHAAQAVRVEDDRVGPHLWNGISRVRVNCGTAIVGSPQQAADELFAYWRLGIDEFILSGYPHPEEAERVASDVIPLLRARIEAGA
jgi:alkanesulfonate monooxygenase